jgi:predicted nucleic acid-binding protein
VIHLDTSFLIRALAPDSAQDRKLRQWIRAPEPLAMSAIGWAEFLCGPVKKGEIALATQVIPARIPFTSDEAHLSANLFNQSGRRRGSLADCMIAASAIHAGAALATANPLDFRHLETYGLRLADC